MKTHIITVSKYVFKYTEYDIDEGDPSYWNGKSSWCNYKTEVWHILLF